MVSTCFASLILGAIIDDEFLARQIYRASPTEAEGGDVNRRSAWIWTAVGPVGDRTSTLSPTATLLEPLSSWTRRCDGWCGCDCHDCRTHCIGEMDPSAKSSGLQSADGYYFHQVTLCTDDFSNLLYSHPSSLGKIGYCQRQMPKDDEVWNIRRSCSNKLRLRDCVHKDVLHQYMLCLLFNIAHTTSIWAE